MVGSDGKVTNEQQSIADIFAAFYEDLYQRQSAEGEELDDTNDNNSLNQSLPTANNTIHSIVCNNFRGLTAIEILAIEIVTVFHGREERQA